MKIIVLNCDVYADIAPAWWYCFKARWADCPYEPIFVTNKVKLDVPARTFYIKGEDRAYGWRMRQFIEQHYSDDLILISMADYLIKSSDQTTIAQAEALCQASNRHIVTVRLRPMPNPSKPFEVDGFGEIDKADRRAYPLSLQPGIWRTDVLYDLLRDDEDPWQTEVNGSYRASRHPGTFLSTTAHVLPHINYYTIRAKDGRVTEQTKTWVRTYVPEEYWPRAAREK